MSEERKPVVCPWCKNKGIESLMTKQRDSVDMESGDDYYYCLSCHSHSPHIHTVGGEWDMADKECYAAATTTPPNRPLTDMTARELCETMNAAMKQTEALAVELASRTGLPVKVVVEAGQPADIAAARKEREHRE